MEVSDQPEDESVMSHPHDALVRRHYAALEAGDLETLSGLLAADVAWHVPGDGHLSGTWKGVDAVLSLFGRVYDLTGGTLRTTVEDVVADDRHAVVTVTVRATIAGADFEDAAVHIARIADGRILDVRTWSSDQAAFDALIDAELAARA
jgi:ketosteroid isomerase-like protein